MIITFVSIQILQDPKTQSNAAEKDVNSVNFTAPMTTHSAYFHKQFKLMRILRPISPNSTNAILFDERKTCIAVYTNQPTKTQRKIFLTTPQRRPGIDRSRRLHSAHIDWVSFNCEKLISQISFSIKECRNEPDQLRVYAFDFGGTRRAADKQSTFSSCPAVGQVYFLTYPAWSRATLHRSCEVDGCQVTPKETGDRSRTER